LEGVSKVCFKQLWQTEKDLKCEDMQVLKMKAQIFIGFKNN
jgi:CRISPR type III-associated protein (TIGR04423 family)